MSSSSRKPTASQEMMLLCGVLAAVLYAAMMLLIGLMWPDYSAAHQTVSELSSIGAPTRPLWVALGLVYTALMGAFGYGVVVAGRTNARLRVVGWTLMAHAFSGLFWPPMQQRGAPFATTDLLHIVFGALTIAMMITAIAFGAAALGKRFRVYSLATLAVFVVFGTLTGLVAPAIATNGPTPWIGVWERINIGAFLAWLVVFAAMLLSARGAAQSFTGAGSASSLAHPSRR